MTQALALDQLPQTFLPVQNAAKHSRDYAEAAAAAETLAKLVCSEWEIWDGKSREPFRILSTALSVIIAQTQLGRYAIRPTWRREIDQLLSRAIDTVRTPLERDVARFERATIRLQCVLDDRIRVERRAADRAWSFVSASTVKDLSDAREAYQRGEGEELSEEAILSRIA